MNQISEKTAVSLGLVVSLVGAIAWLTNIAFQVDALAKRVSAWDQVQIDIAVIKEKVQSIEKKVNERNP